jgi:2-dehydro-3-deoxyphosphogluconate aldolase/(4S)-4-hydroxy-2-oxoglutarate aldolase
MKDAIDRILCRRIVAVLRLPDSSKVLKIAEALQKGGVDIIELTMTTTGALSGIEALAKTMPEILVGAGSVLDSGAAMDAVSAGARFIVSPAYLPEVMHMAQTYGAASVPGAYTPTEILTAHRAGADLVKVFPADSLGPAYFRALLSPMPELKLMPTGGVTPENAGEWIRAGAAAVGIGSALVGHSSADRGCYGEITQKARTAVSNIGETP